jgi:hypothetical protein
MCRWLTIVQKRTATRASLRLISLALLLAGFLSFRRDNVIAQEVVPPQEFIALLEEATKAQERHFANVGMRIKYHKIAEFATNPPRKTEEVVYFEYKARSPLWQLKASSPLSQLKGFNGGEASEQTRLVNEKGYFLIERLKGEHDSKLVQFDEDRDDGIERIMDALWTAINGQAQQFDEDRGADNDRIMELSMVPRAPCYFGEHPLVAFCKRPVNPWKTTRNGDVYQTRYEVPNDPVFYGEVTYKCLSKISQIEHRRFFVKKEDWFWRQLVEYEGESEGVPLVKRVEVASKVPEENITKVWQVLEWIPGPFPESDFTLASHGITPSYTPRWYHVIAGCLVLFLVGAVVWRVRRNKRSSTEPSA